MLIYRVTVVIITVTHVKSGQLSVAHALQLPDQLDRFLAKHYDRYLLLVSRCAHDHHIREVRFTRQNTKPRLLVVVTWPEADGTRWAGVSVCFLG